MPKAKSDSNAALTQKVLAAEARAEQARARATLVRAQVEVKGKVITYDYSNGQPKMKVVDRPKK
jgi:hypothetical protein